MRTTFLTMMALAAATATPALADGFSGTWKADLSSASLPQKPDSFAIVKGVYTCSTCVPTRNLPADGAFHPVANHPFIDEEAVKVVDAKTIQFSFKFKGKLTGTGTSTVSADGNTLSETFTTISDTGKEAKTTGEETRTAAGPAGSHAASGTWKQVKFASADDNALLLTIAETGNGLTMSWPTGETFTAVYGGPPVPFKNDSSGMMITAARKDAHIVVVTDLVAGKPTDVHTMMLAADGKSFTDTDQDLRHGESTTITLVKQ